MERERQQNDDRKDLVHPAHVDGEHRPRLNAARRHLQHVRNVRPAACNTTPRVGLQLQ